MSAPTEPSLLELIRSAGGIIELAPAGKFRVKGPKKVTRWVQQMLAQYPGSRRRLTDELVTPHWQAIQDQVATWPQERRVEFEERSAICEYQGGATRRLADVSAFLQMSMEHPDEPTKRSA